MKTVVGFVPIFILLLVLASCRKTEETVSVQKVVLDKSETELMVGHSLSLVAKVLPENATEQGIKWSSNAPEIAVVDKEGQVTAISVGTVTIIATSADGGKSASCNVNVVPLEEGVTIEPAILKLTIGGVQTLKTVVNVPLGGEKSLKWGSSNEKVATVDSQGQVVALTAGETVITATTMDGKYTNRCEVTVFDLKMSFVPIPAGNFLMGSPEDEPGRDTDETQHQVTLSKEYQMSTYEVTNEQYCAFLNLNEIKADAKWASATIDVEQTLVFEDIWGVRYDANAKEWKPATGKENFPVVSVTWFGAMEFAAWLGGKLPTEAQWEYACKGQNTDKPFGLADGNKLDQTMGNFFWTYPFDMAKKGEYADKTQGTSKTTVAVGSYAANSYGLYDMHGNVFEWCSDWYHPSYGTEDITKLSTNPLGAEIGANRVLKGGSWYYFSRACRSAFRLQAPPEQYGNNIGFRVIRL